MIRPGAKALATLLLFVGVFGPLTKMLSFNQIYLWLMIHLLCPIQAPYTGLPEKSETQIEQAWILQDSADQEHRIFYHQEIGKIRGPSRSRLPLYFAEAGLPKKDPLAQALVKNWICRNSGVPNPRSLRGPDFTLEVDCAP